MKQYTKDSILSEIQRVATILGKESLMLKEFHQHSPIGKKTVSNTFGNWSMAVIAAGLKPTDRGALHKERLTIPDEVLLKELYDLYVELGKKPTEGLISARLNRSAKTYAMRWGSVTKALLEAQKLFATGQSLPIQFQDKEGKLKRLPISNSQPIKLNDVSSKTIKIIPQTIKPATPLRKQRIVGEPIHFRGLTHAPINEQGVVYLFGMVSHELGFHIESIKSSFPDCEGKRCYDQKDSKWENIKIEFEYKSSNFKDHLHNAEECDIIVCWIHDWQDCPIEVMVLKDVIKNLPN